MYRFSRFSAFASRVARTLGHPATFMLFLGAALVWLATGPLFHFNQNWYSAYSNAATIVTTLLLFLIQHTQSREMASVQLKLNEIIRVSEGAHNALLDIEELTNRDYDQIKASYTTLANQAREQLRGGKLKWATARVSMESFDSLLDPSALKEEEEELEGAPVETAAARRNQRRNAPLARLAPALDRMARIAAHSGHAPMALIALNDEDHDWLHRQIGFVEVGDAGGEASGAGEAQEAGREERGRLARFFVSQVFTLRQPIRVEDTGRQPLPEGLPEAARVGAYLALPLIAAHQRVIGCLAVLDARPRTWSDTEVAALVDLAALTVEQIVEQAHAAAGLAVAQAAVDIASAASAASAQAAPDAAPQGENETMTQHTEQAKMLQNDTAPEPGEETDGETLPGTILVVDDSETNRTLLRRRLEREGYRVVVAGNGQEALDCLQAEPVGLLLLDVMMPEMDGEEVLQQMQADDRLRQIPVIMVTALDEQASVQRCLQAGAKDYILKPFDPAQLRARVHAYLPPAQSASA